MSQQDAKMRMKRVDCGSCPSKFVSPTSGEGPCLSSRPSGGPSQSGTMWSDAVPIVLIPVSTVIGLIFAVWLWQR